MYRVLVGSARARTKLPCSWSLPRIAVSVMALFLLSPAVFAAGAGETGAGEGRSGDAATQTTTITVLGAGSVIGVPDTAVFSVGVEVTGDSPEAVLAAIRARSESVLRALRALGIAEGDLQTTHYNVRTERRAPRSEDEPAQTRYVGTTGLRINVSDLDNLDEVMSTATDAGATEIRGVSFGVSNAAQLHDEARLSALEDARRKAEGIAAAQGLQLSGIRSISTQQQPSSRLFETAQAVGRGGGGISPGELDFQEAVTVVFTAQ